MGLCDQTQHTFASSSLLKLCLFSILIAITFTSADDVTFSDNRNIVTSGDARGRRQAIVSSSILIPGSANNAPDSGNTALTRRRNCPRKCRCNSPKEVICTLRSITIIPQYLPPNRVKISFAYNKLTKLPNSAFVDHASSLKGLFLQANQLSSIEGAFNSLSQLEILRLSWNRLSAIRKSTFLDLSGLRRLYLDNNRITFFHPEALRGLVKLKLLQLEGNRLSQLHPDVFITLQFSYYYRFSHIQYLYLSNNQFQTLPSTMFPEMAHLQEVYLHGNPWECSCQLQWLHQWMRDSGKYRCKKPILRRQDPPVCAVCAMPRHLKGQEVAKVSHDNITCFSPRIIGQEIFSSSELFTEIPSITAMQNEAFLFRYSFIRHPSFSLQLDGGDESLILMHCNVTRYPRATLEQAGDTYYGHFDQALQCRVEIPTNQERLTTILNPYLNFPLTLVADDEESLDSTNVNYNLQPQDEFLPYLSETSDRIESAVLMSDYPIFKSQEIIITLYGNHFYPEQRLASLLFESSVEYRLNETDNFEARNIPWVKAGSPSPLMINTDLVLEGSTKVLRCRAMGFPKPYLSWILPDGTHIRPMNRIDRFKVNRGGRLIIQGASRRDEGVYRCLSQSIATEIQHPQFAADIGSLRLHVIPSVTLFPSLVRNINAEDGSSWIHPCNTEGVPDAEVAWITPDNQLLIKDEQQISNVMVHENKSISIANVESQHKGIYRCIAANHIGAAEVAIHLNVMEIRRQLDGEISDTSVISTPQATTSTAVFSTAPEEVVDVSKKELPLVESVEPVDSASFVSTYSNSLTTPAPTKPTTYAVYAEEETTQKVETSEAVTAPPTTTKMEPTTTLKATPVETSTSAGSTVMGSKSTKQTKTEFTPEATTQLSDFFETTNVATTLVTTSSETTTSKIPNNAEPDIQKSKPNVLQPTSDLVYYEEPITQNQSITKSLEPEELENEVNKDVPVNDIDLFPGINEASTNTSKPTQSTEILDTDDGELPSNVESSYEEKINGIINTPSKTSEEMATSPSLDSVTTSSLVLVEDMIRESFDKLVHPPIISSSPQQSYDFQSIVQGQDLLDNADGVQSPVSSPRVIRVNFGQSFSIVCPLEERSGLTWEFYPYLSSTRRGNTRRFSGVFANDGDVENVMFNGTKEISVTRATSNHNGTFLCRNSDPTFSWTHVVVTTTPPRFTLPGFNGVTVEYGKSVSIPCAARGIPKPEITWSWPNIMDGVMMTSNDAPTTRVYARPPDLLHIEEITHDYGLTYVCTARNDFGEIRHSVLVTVSSMTPSIQKGSLKKMANEGEATILDCVTSGTPKPKVEWILPTGAIVSDSNNSLHNTNVLSNGSLVLLMAGLADQGSYGCIATNPIGQASVEIILSVLPGLNLNLRRDVPSLVSQSESHPQIALTTETASTTTTERTATIPESPPNDDESEFSHQYATLQRVRVGKTAFLKCRVHFPQESDVIFSRTRRRYPYRYRKSRVTAQWVTPSGGLAAFPYPIPSWRHRVFMNGTLRITNVRMKDGGIYACVAKDRQGRKIQTIINLMVIAQAPVMRQSLHQVVEVSKDNAAWAPCSASGYPKPRITWMTPSGRSFSSGSFGTGLRVYSSGKLMLYGVNTNTAGTYTCTASNPGGSVTRVVVFKLRTFTPIIRGVRSTTQHVRYGRTAKLSCTAIGVPEPYMYWTMPGGRSIQKNEGVFVRGQSRSKISMLSSGTLVINRASHSDAGYYHCYATNRIGTATKTIHLKVYY